MRQLGRVLEAELVEVVHPAATIVPLHCRVTSRGTKKCRIDVLCHEGHAARHMPVLWQPPPHRAPPKDVEAIADDDARMQRSLLRRLTWLDAKNRVKKSLLSVFIWEGSGEHELREHMPRPSVRSSRDSEASTNYGPKSNNRVRVHQRTLRALISDPDGHNDRFGVQRFGRVGRCRRIELSIGKAVLTQGQEMKVRMSGVSVAALKHTST